MKIKAKALVSYICYLTEENEEKVLSYAKENGITIDEAITELWENDEIDIYAGEQTESECETQEVCLLEE